MRVLLAAGLAGFAALTVEVAGVHLLAPWFGASALVWSNQIGIILLAMAAGGWLGGRRARSGADPVRQSGAFLLAAGLLHAAAVVLLPLFARWLLPGALRLDEAAGVFLGGSLAAALLFFAPPVFLLAMVAPVLVEARAARAGAGHAAGEIYAAGTVGSLLGVFGSTWLALPFLGLRLTLLLTAGALLAAGLLLCRTRRSAALFVPLVLLPLLQADPAAAANLPEGQPKVLEAVDTPYQHLRVIEFPDGARWLQMNEGLDSYQSVWSPDTAWPGGYYDLFALAPVYALEGADPAAPVRCWSLGAGAGASLLPVAVALQGRDWNAVGVELDPAVARLAARWMPLPAEVGAHVEMRCGVDARALLRAAPADLDFLLLDAYTRQFEIPAHLASQEFFAEAAAHLRDGGVLAINLGTARATTLAESVVDTVRASLAASFGDALRLHEVPGTRNAMLFARKHRPLPELARLPELLPAHSPDVLGAACFPARVEDGLRGSAAPASDDRNPMEWMQQRVWLQGTP